MDSTFEEERQSIISAYRAGELERVVAMIDQLSVPPDGDIIRISSHCLMALGRYDEAVKRFDSLQTPGYEEKSFRAWAIFKSGEKDEALVSIEAVIRDHTDHALPHCIAADILWDEETQPYISDESIKSRIKALLLTAIQKEDAWPQIYRNYARLLGYDEEGKTARLNIQRAAHERWPQDLLLRAEYGSSLFAENTEEGSAILAPVLAQGIDKRHIGAELIARSCQIDLAVSDERYVDALDHLHALVPAHAKIDAIYHAQLAFLAGDVALANNLMSTISEPSWSRDKVRYWYTKAAVGVKQGKLDEAIVACRTAQVVIDKSEPIDKSFPLYFETTEEVRHVEPIDSPLIVSLYRELQAGDSIHIPDVLAYLECQQAAFDDSPASYKLLSIADSRAAIEYVKCALFRHALETATYDEALRYGLDAFVTAHEKGKSLDEVYLYSETADGRDMAGSFQRQHIERVTDAIEALCRQKKTTAVRGFYRQYLRDWVLATRANEGMIRICRALIGRKKRGVSPEDLFDLGLAHQQLGQDDEAQRYYAQIVGIKKPIRAALYNLSLIHSNGGRIDAALELLERLQPFDDDKYAAHYRTLSEIRDRRDDLSHFSIVYNPAKPPVPIQLPSLSIRDLLYLVTIIYGLQGSNHDELVPEENAPFKLTPYGVSTKGLLSHLSKRGLLYMDVSTPKGAYRIDGENLTYTLSKTKWRLNVVDANLPVRHVLTQVENCLRDKLREESDDGDAIGEDIALWEVLGYLLLRMEAYGYEYTITDKTIAVFREMLMNFSVAQCWNIVYQAMESAVAKQREERLTNKHTQNLAVVFCRTRAQKAIDSGWTIKPYDRPNEFPESAVTHAWCYITRVSGSDFLRRQVYASA